MLLAIYDAQYCFTLVNTWSYESNNNSGILAKSQVDIRSNSGKMNIQQAKGFAGFPEKPRIIQSGWNTSSQKLVDKTNNWKVNLFTESIYLLPVNGYTYNCKQI